LGFEFCRHYVDRGHQVVTFARSLTPELAALEGESQGRLRCLELDLLEPGAPRRAAESASEAFGGIDVLINNVAVGQDSLFAHTSDEEIERIVTLNVTRTLQLTRHIVRVMIPRGGGTVLNVSSICGLRGYAGLVCYSATKGAIDAFTRCAAREFGRYGITVNSVAPGFFESEMSRPLAADQRSKIGRRTPTGRLSDAAQVVEASQPLINGRELNINGVVLAVDGGAAT
jgi:3-oxoacyl-[acyl-carrier protein] reductase